jgi:hypothetical protein
MLFTQTASGGGSGMGSGSVAADGSFGIGNVPPGEHFIQVRLAPRPGGPEAPEVANMPIVAAGENITGLQVTTGAGATVTGSVEWEGSAPRTGAPVPLRIAATPDDGRPALIGLIGLTAPGADGLVGADDAFQISGLVGRVRFSPTGLPPQWAVKAIHVNCVDVTTAAADVASSRDTRLRVVLTDAIAEVSGAVKDAAGRPASQSVVVVLLEESVDPGVAARYTRVIRPDQSGIFSVRALPPGRYAAVAVKSLDQGTEWDPEFQRAARALARRFTLTDGQTLRLDLELIR